MAAPVSASATAIEPGHEVGPYVLTREIGKGSFAVVFQGKVQPAGDEKSVDDGQQTTTPSQTASTSASAMQRPALTSVSRVAIKIVTRKKLTPKLLENLEGEISILRTVRHANIVELLDCLKTNSHIYLVMQYCRMGDLSNFIRTRRRTAESPSTAAAASTSTKDAGQSSTNARSKSLFEEDMDKQYPHPHDGGLHSEMVRSFLAQLASALQFMRSKNIVHRDIKPQNLLLQEPEGSTIRAGHPALIPQLKVADFGFARHLEAASLAETLCGSPLYMAPEILRYEKYDAKADLWSVGAVLYEMCVGKPPFRASNHVELLRRIERGEDKIRFPDERSDDSLKREQVRKASDGGSGKDVSKPVRPHEVDGDIKQLIRALLRRRPIERMSFDDFFFCEVLQEYKQRTISPSPLHGSGDQFDTASMSLTPSPASSNVMSVVAKRVAPAIPSTQAHRPSAKTDLAHSNELTQAHGNPETDTSSAPTVGAAAAFAIPRYFTSKYVVGGHRSPEKQEEGNKDEQSPCARTTPLGKDTANRINRTSAARDNHEGEASSLEDNVLETPGSSVTHLPSTAHQDLPQTTPPTSGDSMREKRASAVYDDDRGYVLVDKRNLDVNAAAEEIMNNKAKGRLGAGAGGWSPLGVVRRPSQLGRLASLSGAINPLSSGGANTPPLPVQQTSTPPPLPSPRRFSTSGPATATAIPTTTTSTKTTTATKSSPSSASPSSIAKSSSPSHPRLGSTPPNAAFALPPNARKPSFSRRTSNTSDYARPIITRPPMSPLAPAPTAIQAATTASASGMASTSAPVTSTMDSSALASLQPQPSSSALSRAISMASIRLFGVPTNLSMRGAGVRRSLRMGLGTTGTLLSSSPGQTATSETQTLAAVDVAEQNLLSLLHEYGQKSFVLSEFADARLSTFFAEGPHQNNFVDRRAASNSSLSSMTGALHRQPGVKSTGTGTTTVGGGANDKAVASAEKCDESAEKGTLSSPKPSEVAASEAYVLYVRSLSFLQRGMDAARDYLEARSLSSGTASRYANTLLSSTGGGVGTGGSLDVVEAMQWLRAKFADGVERAKFARAKSVEEMPESAQYIDKMIFEEALEVARRAAIDELANSRAGTDDVHASSTTSLSSWNGERCLLAYETACTMLQSLLDPPPEHLASHMADGATIGPATKELSTSAIGTIEKFITSISKRMQSIQRKLEAQGNIATSLNN